MDVERCRWLSRKVSNAIWSRRYSRSASRKVWISNFDFCWGSADWTRLFVSIGAWRVDIPFIRYEMLLFIRRCEIILRAKDDVNNVLYLPCTTLISRVYPIRIVIEIIIDVINSMSSIIIFTKFSDVNFYNQCFVLRLNNTGFNNQWYNCNV